MTREERPYTKRDHNRWGSQVISTPTEIKSTGEEKHTRHTFWLRNDLQVFFDLPQSITKHEAERLAMVITAIPID